MPLSRGCRSPIALIAEAAHLSAQASVALLADLETNELHPLETDWVGALLAAPPESALVAASPEREAKVIAALSALGIGVLGGDDRLLAMGGDRALLSAWLRGLNLPALPVFRPEAAPPLPRPFDLALGNVVAGSRTLQPTSEQELTELQAMLSATVANLWWSPRVEERVVVGVIAGEPLGTVGLRQVTRPQSALVAMQATIPAPLSAVEASAVMALARRAAASLQITAPCEVELGRLEGRYVICDVRRNLSLDGMSALGRLLVAYGISRREVYAALRTASLCVASSPARSLPAVSSATVH